MPKADEREAFDEAATIYHAARPAYPAELYDELVGLTTITTSSELLEIGCGPGTATVELAGRGFKITAIEPGPALADQARRNLASYPAASVITSGFESWQPADEATYDLIYAANAWHWLDPELRWAKAAGLIPPGGHLALFGASHAFPEGFDPFFTEIQQVYDELGESRGDWPPPPPRSTVGPLIAEAEGTGRFREVAQRRYVRPLDYTADTYIDLLSTFANHIVMEAAKRERIFAEVRRLLAERPDGRVTRHWLFQLAIVQRI